jgi:hypothetical protein
MKRTITFWKNSGHLALRGRTEELFKVSWDDELGEWIRDEEGKYWGMYKLDPPREVRRLTRDPESMGVVKDLVDDEEIVTFTQEQKVDHLEANDTTVTPEGGDLGEEN